MIAPPRPQPIPVDHIDHRTVGLEPLFAPMWPSYQPFPVFDRFPFLFARFSSARGEKAVVFSRGALSLDDCDFSGSSASVLVYSEGDTPMIRNAFLGHANCESFGSRAFHLLYLRHSHPEFTSGRDWAQDTFATLSELWAPSNFVHPAQATTIPGFCRLRRQWCA